MGELRKIGVDDEDDTLLFQRLEEHVLEHYPNPRRVDCFERETLTTFVEHPATLDLEDPKYLHIFECAECTRDLIELRRLREERLAREMRPILTRRTRRWRSLAIAAAVVLMTAAGLAGWRYRSTHFPEAAQNLEPVSVIVDLSADGAERDAGQESNRASVSLPARRVNLRLILPFYSPGGRYLVTVSGDRSRKRVQASATSAAFAQGSHTELTVQLNLLRLEPGAYFLGTIREDDGGAYYYPITIR